MSGAANAALLKFVESTDSERGEMFERLELFISENAQRDAKDCEIHVQSDQKTPVTAKRPNQPRQDRKLKKHGKRSD